MGVSKVGIQGAKLELYRSNGLTCNPQVVVSPEPTTNAEGKYTIKVAAAIPYKVCVKSKTPTNCSQIDGNKYETIVNFTKTGEIVSGVDFSYECP